VARLEGLAAHNELGRRGGNRAGLNVRRLLETSNAKLDSTELLEARQWGEALMRSIEVWRHREARRAQGARS
jgi:hypothetical protein